MKRRDFITLLGGAAAAWPLVARAQQTSKVAHLRMLLPSEGGVGGEREAITAGLQRLRKLGWTDGDNLRITYKWFAGMDFEVLRANAAELVGASPDVVWVVSNPALAALQRTTRRYQPYSCRSPIPWAAASSKALPDPAATPPASRISRTRWGASGSSYCMSSRRVQRVRWCSAIRKRPRIAPFIVPSKPQHPRWGSR